jgi:hypothetical protein
MEEPKTIFPEAAILFHTWSAAAVGVTAGTGVGGFSVRHALTRIAITRHTNTTGLIFILSLLVEESFLDLAQARLDDWH